MNLNKYTKRICKHLKYWGFAVEEAETGQYSAEIYIFTPALDLSPPLYLYINPGDDYVSLGQLGDTLDNDRDYLSWQMYKPKVIAELVRATLFVP